MKILSVRMRGGKTIPGWTICTILAAVSCGVYLNTLQAGFTFDDFFAVVSRHFILISRAVCFSCSSSLAALQSDWHTSCCVKLSHESERV